MISLIATVLVIIAASSLSGSVGTVVITKLVSSQEYLSSLFASYPELTSIFSFVLLYIVFSIIKMIVLSLLTPIVEKIVNVFSLTGFINKLLGGIINTLIGLVVVVVILLGCYLPWIPDGSTYVEASTIGTFMMEKFPYLSEYVDSLEIASLCANIDTDDIDEQTIMSIVSLVEASYDNGMLTESTIQEITSEYADALSAIDEVYEVSSEDYDKIVEVLNLPGVDEQFRNTLLEKVTCN